MKRIMMAFLLAMLVSSCGTSRNGKQMDLALSKTQVAEKNPIVLSFTIMQGGSTTQGSVTRIGFIKQDCLKDIQTCPENILVLPEIVAKDMGPTIAWSPDGKKLMFVSDLSGNPDIYSENVDGSDRKNITNSPEREDCSAWSPDGNYILYNKESTVDGNPQVQIWIVKSDGSGAQLLAEGNCPTWSPDGSNILFTKQNNGNDNSGSVTSVLYTMHVSDILNGATQGEPIPLTDGSTLASCPLYSPDGKKIAYLEIENDNNVLKVIDADGKNLIALNEIEGGVGCAAWSPDSSNLAFTVSKTHNSPADVYMLTIGTRTITRITESPELTSNGDPFWSPDGTMLVFNSTMISGYFDLLVYKISEKKLLMLTAASIDNEYYSPSWRSVQK